jgi:hypothetical protein
VLAVKYGAIRIKQKLVGVESVSLIIHIDDEPGQAAWREVRVVGPVGAPSNKAVVLPVPNALHMNVPDVAKGSHLKPANRKAVFWIVEEQEFNAFSSGGEHPEVNPVVGERGSEVVESGNLLFVKAFRERTRGVELSLGVLGTADLEQGEG